MPPHHVASGSVTASPRACVAALAGLLLTACGGAGEQTPSPLVTQRDSAGIMIVEHSAGAMAALPTWTLDAAPARVVRDSIGLTKVGLAVPWSDDRVVLRDDGLRGLWVFRFDDDLATPLARPGQGPGDVQYVSFVQRLDGDTLLVFDYTARRLSVFDPDGRFVRSRRYPSFADGATVRVRLLLPDGRLLGTTAPRSVPRTDLQGILRRDTIAIVGFRAPVDERDVYAVDTIVRVPDALVFNELSEIAGESSPETYHVHLGPSTHFTSAGPSLWVGTNERFELRRYERDTLRQLVRVAGPAKPVPSDAGDRVKAWYRAGLEKQRAPVETHELFEDLMRHWRFATELPFHGRLLVGLDGTLWAEEEPVVADDPRRFLVFGADGRAMAYVTLPVGVVPLQVSLDGVLASRVGVDDKPEVGRWRLQR
jgi:hypothetical protein